MSIYAIFVAPTTKFKNYLEFPENELDPFDTVKPADVGDFTHLQVSERLQFRLQKQFFLMALDILTLTLVEKNLVFGLELLHIAENRAHGMQ